MPGAAALQETEGGVRDACLRAALEIIISDGADRLSIREVSRRLDLSHQAPYKHFVSRDQLIAEVIGGCFDEFGHSLPAAAEAADEPVTALLGMGQAYLRYAADNPAKYRIMFSDPLPPAARDLRMAGQVKAAYDVLRDSLLRLYQSQRVLTAAAEADRNALHIWATLHGLATILQHDTTRVLELAPSLLEDAPHYTFVCLRPLLFPPS